MLKVCLSGFEDKDERAQLTHYIKELHLKLERGLTFQVDVLICSSVKQDKYKIAKIRQIKVVTANWVYKSYEAGSVLDCRPYLIKQFRQVTLTLLGFPENEYEKAHSFIIDNEGVCNAQIVKQTDIIVIKKGSAIEFELKDTLVATVDSDWLIQCYLRQQFVPTEHYQYNAVKIDKKLMLEELVGSKVQEALSKLGLNEYLYLQDIVCFIAIKDDQMVKVLQQLISVGDGLYVNQMLPVVTHIIYLPGLSQDIMASFGQAKIVHPWWLYDCFRYRCKVVDDDYQIRMLKHAPTQEISTHSLGSQINSDYEAKRDLFLLGNIEQAPQQEENRTSRFGLRSSSLSLPSFQAISNQNSIPLMHNRFSMNLTKNKLFGNCYFYIFEHPTLNMSMLPQIIQYGGQHERIAFPIKIKPHMLKPPNDRQIAIFLMPDSDITRKTQQLLEQECRQLTNKKYFSYRWAQYCMDKNILEFQVLNKNLFHLLATGQSTPIASLKDKHIHVSIKDPNDKLVFTAIAQLLSGIECHYNLDELQYFVTEHDCKKLKSIEEANEKMRLFNPIEIQTPEWLLKQFQG